MILSEEQRRALTVLRLGSADEALADASTLLEHGSLRGAMNRCYYALFHTTSALAIRDDLTVRTHSGLISYFHKAYVKTDRLPRDMGRILQEAFENRYDADYKDMIRFDADDVSELLKEARRFVAEVKSLLQAN